MPPSIHFILGQTATGKTAHAASLALKLKGELVNCDSRQLYRGLDIITGKTDNPDNVPTHMVNIVNPDETYSAYDFACQAIIIIQDIISRDKTPIVVGGTGNYARMLMYSNPTKTSKKSIAPASEYRSQLDTLSKEELQVKLLGLNDKLFYQLNPSDKENPRRLIRAIERIESCSPDVLDMLDPRNLAHKYDPQISVLIHKDQKVLTARIDLRIEERLQQGAINECQKLLALGYKRTDPGLATIGYQSIFRYLDGIVDYATMKTEWAHKEYQYSKRQKTYLLKYFPQAGILHV